METTTTEAPAELPAGKVIEKKSTFSAGGHEWRIVFKSSIIARVKQLHGVDFWEGWNLREDGPLVRIGSDERLLIEVLWTICEEQSANHSLDKDAFSDLFAGEIFDESYEAIQGGLLAFFSGARASLFRQTLEQLSKMGKRQENFVRDLYAESDKEESAALDMAKKKFSEATRKALPSKIQSLIDKAVCTKPT
jgi:hypothetical protein